MSKKIATLAIFVSATLTLGACSSMCKVDGGSRAAAAETAPAISVETFTFKTPVKNLMITNTTGITQINNIATASTATLNVAKVKTSEICEFNQEQKGSTLFVGVRNKGFTGGGDCEINLEVSLSGATEVNVTSTTGPVEIGIPNTSKPNVKFETQSGQMTTEFKSAGKGSPKIIVRTQSGNLNVKGL